MSSLYDDFEKDYQNQLQNRKTIFQPQQTSYDTSTNNSVNPYHDCRGLFQCANISSSYPQTSMSQNAQVTTNNTLTTMPSSTQPLTDLQSQLPQKTETICNCPPQLSAEDVAKLDLIDADEKALSRGLEDANNLQQSGIKGYNDVQNAMFDQVWDGVTKANSLSQSIIQLDSTAQQQALANSMPDNMIDSINAATQPIKDQIRQLTENIDNMSGVVKRTRDRCNSVRFAFGRGPKI
jgi:hypothetical protein